MKNIELYRTIQSLVEARRAQANNSTNRSFAHDYCKEKIMSKKLVPFNPRSKMNKIMQNFHQLDTYVNMEQLFENINNLIVKKNKEVKSTGCRRIGTLRQSEYNNIKAMEKVREKLGPYNQKRNHKEVLQIDSINNLLERQCSLQSLRKQNSTSEGNYNYIVKQLATDPKSVHQKYWNRYEDSNYQTQNVTPSQSFSANKNCGREDAKQKLAKTELIHQVSTYLQIILENQHRQKWGSRGSSPKQQKNITDMSLEQRRKLGKKTSCNLTMRANSQNSSYHNLRSVPDTPIPRPILRKKHKFSNKKTVKDTFTFRNRNIKGCLLKKIDNFMEFVESEQKISKKEKVYLMGEINRLESKYKVSEDLVHMPEEHEIREVRKIVHLQK